MVPRRPDYDYCTAHHVPQSVAIYLRVENIWSLLDPYVTYRLMKQHGHIESGWESDDLLLPGLVGSGNKYVSQNAEVFLEQRKMLSAENMLLLMFYLHKFSRDLENSGKDPFEHINRMTLLALVSQACTDFECQSSQNDQKRQFGRVNIIVDGHQLA